MLSSLLSNAQLTVALGREDTVPFLLSFVISEVNAGNGAKAR